MFATILHIQLVPISDNASYTVFTLRITVKNHSSEVLEAEGSYKFTLKRAMIFSSFPGRSFCFQNSYKTLVPVPRVQMRVKWRGG